MARLTINLDEDLKEEVEKNASISNQSLSQYVVTAIEYYIDMFSPDDTKIEELQQEVSDIKDEVRLLKSSQQTILRKLEEKEI